MAIKAFCLWTSLLFSNAQILNRQDPSSASDDDENNLLHTRIQSHCNSFFEKNDSPHLCAIMYQATNQTLFSSPSLGLVKKGLASSEALPTCPPLSWDKTPEFIQNFAQKLYNQSIHEWEPGELESYQPLATSKVTQIANQLGFKLESYQPLATSKARQRANQPRFKGVFSISTMPIWECAMYGELPFVAVDHNAGMIKTCKPIYRDLIGLNGVDLQQEAEGIIAHEIGHLAFQDSYGFNAEIQADLYTLRDGRIGRGNLNALKRLQKFVPLEIEVQKGLDPSHPYLFERIQYLTEGLCGIYPEQNRDIC